MLKRYFLGIVVVCIAAAGCSRVKAADRARKGHAHFEAQRYQEAIIEYRGALQANPKLGDVRLKLGDAYMATNDPRNALREYVRAAPGVVFLQQRRVRRVQHAKFFRMM